MLHAVSLETLRVTSMVYLILVGAAIFSSVLRGFGGDVIIEEVLLDLPGGVFSAMLVVMLLIFLLGFILDFIEITFMVVPLVGPILLSMGLDPIWLGIMIAINLADFISHAALWLFTFLFAQRRAAGGAYSRHLLRRDSVCVNAIGAAVIARAAARNRHVAAGAAQGLIKD